MSHSADSPGPGASPGHRGTSEHEAPHSEGGGPPRRRRFRGAPVLTGGVFALAGLIFVTSFNTAKGTNLRTDSSLLKLSDLIQERSRNNGSLERSNAELREDVDALASRDSGSTDAEKRQLAALERESGTAALKGEAVTVTLDDAPPDAGPRLPGYPEPQPNDLVIHQQDLQAVVNALWKGGARGIKVMDQRLISTSAVRCVGNTLILQGRVYSPPYKVTAVGDTEVLKQALADSPEIQNYMLYVNAYGLGWDVKDAKAVTLPGYSGTVDLHHAEPSE